MNHTVFRFITFCCLCLVIPSAMAQSDAESRGFARQESSQIFDERENYAVIVGVDSYDLATPLNYAVADAMKLAEFFESQGYVVELLLNDSATPSRILRRLSTVGEVATNGGTLQQGNLVFAFSGHGFREDGKNYLATGETDPNRIQATSLSLGDVQRTLRDTGVRQRVLFIDACRNDPAKGGAYENGTFEQDINAEGEAIFYSTRSGTLSWEDPRLGHGVFTHYLVKGLEGAAKGDDGLISFNDLQRYVVGEVKRHVLQQFNKSQIPYIGGERTGEFVVAKYDTSLTHQSQPSLNTANYAMLERELNLSRDARLRIQQALNADGQQVGVPDGIFGENTRKGIRRWRESNGLESSDFLDSSSYKILMASLPAVPLQPQQQSFEPAMIRIEGGTFEMGSRNSSYDAERPVRTVRIPDFNIGKYEITFEQFDIYAKSTGISLPDDKGWGRGRRPVINVSWTDVQGYIEWINANTSGGYRLPSEAEWEYATRAGSQSNYFFGDDDSQLCEYANGTDQNCTDGYKRTAPVGSYKPNDNGLYDTHGNVWEWTEDCWHETYKKAPSNEKPWLEDGDCRRRVLRGGSWFNKPYVLRSAVRSGYRSSERYISAGFRLARTITQ